MTIAKAQAEQILRTLARYLELETGNTDKEKNSRRLALKTIKYLNKKIENDKRQTR